MNYCKIFCYYRCHSYSINGEISNKNALKRGCFKYDILEAIIALGTGSLLYQT